MFLSTCCQSFIHLLEVLKSLNEMLHMVNHIIYTINSLTLWSIHALVIWTAFSLILLQSHYLWTPLRLDPWNSLCLSPGSIAYFLESKSSSFFIYSLVLMKYICPPIVISGSKIKAVSEISVIFPLHRLESWIKLIQSVDTISQFQYIRITWAPIKLESLCVAPGIWSS